MKKLLFAVALMVTGEVFSQQQNIELPDFVITGRQSADVQASQKPKPELISILSQEFFTPQYSPEELPLLLSSEPVSILPDIKTSNEVFSGNLNVKVGKYTLPIGELNLSKSYENYLFSAKLWGVNTTEYIPNSGYNNSGFNMIHDFFTSTRADFLPGSKISVDATYWRDSYKMFCSANPAQIRESNNGNAQFKFSNNYNRFLNSEFGISANYLSLNENNLSEFTIKGNGLLEFKMDYFSLGADADYSIQKFKSDLFPSDSFSSLMGEGYLSANISNSLQLKGGIVFHTGGNSDLFSPFGSLRFQFAKGFLLGFEYKPRVAFLTNRNILDQNLYSSVGTIPNCFTKYNTSFTGSLTYEFQKTFLVNLSFNYSKADNFIYYDDITNAGIFDILVLNDAGLINGKLTLQYHPGDLGTFYGEFSYQDDTDANGFAIPYHPKMNSMIYYSYDFNFGLGVKVGYESCMDVYTNRLNTNQLEDYHNIFASVSFELIHGIKITGDFQNILNRSNFVWKGYQRKPFDYLVGIDYRW